MWLLNLISSVSRYHPDGEESDRVVEVDFTPPFRRISMLEGLEEAGGFKIPLPLESDECQAFLDRVCVDHGVACAEPRSTSQMLDKLVGHFLETRIVK
jgi:lysyl-tRNA synthetase class 2